MSSRKVLLIALATQGALIVFSWWASRALNLWPRWGDPWRDTLIGVAAALGLGSANLWLLTRAPGNWLVDGVRGVYHETIVPLFGRMGIPGAIAIGAAAGVGEEWLFRGVLQPAAGLVVASVVFGLAHVGSVRMVPFGVWAAGMGVVLGGLAIGTGGLLAPMVAHGVYDMLALAYIRRSESRWTRAAVERGVVE